MNALVALCHFCELHGPRTLFCTEAVHPPSPSPPQPGSVMMPDREPEGERDGEGLTMKANSSDTHRADMCEVRTIAVPIFIALANDRWRIAELINGFVLSLKYDLIFSSCLFWRLMFLISCMLRAVAPSLLLTLVLWVWTVRRGFASLVISIHISHSCSAWCVRLVCAVWAVR